MDTTCAGSAAGPLPVINLSNNDDGDNDDGDDSSSKNGDHDFSRDRYGDDDDDSDDFMKCCKTSVPTKYRFSEGLVERLKQRFR